ncbi:MAG: cytochrome c [Gammaproteobacteria bacterium]|nr:cytochrome c [Gammaproteobacteria bacterium]
MKLFDRVSKKVLRGSALIAALSVLTACGGGGGEPAEARLPISINEVMASLINHSADPIWIAAWRNPQSDRDWRELEHLSRQLQVGGALLSIPGTGPLDEEWTSNEGWVNYSNQLSAAAGRAVNAARAEDLQLISRAGDEIVDICEGCHIDFKPDLPTMNIYGELSPLPSDSN